MDSNKIYKMGIKAALIVGSALLLSFGQDAGWLFLFLAIIY